MDFLSSVLLSTLNALPNHVPQGLRLKYDTIIRERRESLDDTCRSTDKTCSPAEIVYQVGIILLGDRCIGKSSRLYHQQQQKNWSQTCWLPATCFLALENVVEVALAMRLIAYLECPFVIRSAGHNANPGFSSIGDRGVVLDLSALRQVQLSTDKRVVSVGPGATWGVVYEILEEYNLTVAGGRVADVGVGGLITGGGMSHFSNYWGFVCDNVSGFEVVTADSRVVYASANENPELYRALKGGGSNFGIVTKFDLYTHPGCHIWWELQKFTAKNITDVIQATVNIQTAMEKDGNIGFFLTIYPECSVAGLLYKGETTQRQLFQEFNDIQPEILIPSSSTTYCSSSRALSMSTPKRREIGTLATKTNAAFYLGCHQVLKEIVADSELGQKSISLYFTFQPIGTAAVNNSVAHGGNMLNLVTGSQIWLAIVAEWEDEEVDDIARSAIRSFINRVQDTAKSQGLLLDTCFMNDASFLQSPWRANQAGLARLLETAKVWDPKDIFQRLQNSGFLFSTPNTMELKQYA